MFDLSMLLQCQILIQIFLVAVLEFIQNKQSGWNWDKLRLAWDWDKSAVSISGARLYSKKYWKVKYAINLDG